MSKTIEEAAKEYNDKHIDETINGLHDDFLSWEPLQDGIINAFKAGANHVYGLPLASRMTAEEKERVREEYSDNKCLIESASLSYVQREVFQKINETLESIFGSDFFKEGE